MPDRAISPNDLVQLLERAHPAPAGAKRTSDVTLEQVDILLARVASLTDALRGALEGEAVHLTGRLLISDLALVTAQFRGRTNELVAALARARGELDNAKRSGSHEETDPPARAEM